MEWSYPALCVLNAYLSYSATMLNIVAIYAIRKTSSLSKNLKTLLLSLAVSDLGVGLLVQPMFVADLMDSKQNNETNESYNAIYIASLISKNFFTAASLFSVTALCADRFLAIRLNLRYQELDIQARCCCRDLNLGDKRTYFNAQIIPSMVHYVREFRHY